MVRHGCLGVQKEFRKLTKLNWRIIGLGDTLHRLSARNQIETPPKTQVEYGPLPRPGLPVQVQCDGFKCMAFLDKEGRWVDLFTREVIPSAIVLGVVRV
jgi:hypothetical protein